jgi:hypothetical protein
MEFHDREYFISRICAGYIRYKINSEITLKIKFPDLHINYISQEIFRDAYQDATDEGLFTDTDVYNLLISKGLWTYEQEVYLKNKDKGIINDIESLKVDLYKSSFDTSHTIQIRKALQDKKDEYLKLINIRHGYDYITCHGVSIFVRWLYIIRNCTFYENNAPYDWKHITIQQAMSYFQKNIIDDEICRELARTEPWSSIWHSAKTNGGLFDKHLTDEQRKILIWTRLYDNVLESPDCPHQNIIDDDDMLDGWLILEKREREKEQVKKRTEDVLLTNEKIAGSDEVFIVAKNKRDIDNIDDLNDPNAKMIKKRRNQQVFQNGKVAHEDLGDVKLDRVMKANKEFIKKTKG